MSNVLFEGISLYNKRNYKDALSFFLALTPEVLESVDNLEFSYYVGLSYARLKKFDEALMYLEQVVTSGENLDRINQCRLTLAVIYSMTDRTKMADFELHKLLEGGFRTASVFCGLAFVAWEQGHEEASIEYYEKALDLEPENATALNGLGYVLTCSGKDLTRALTLCKKAIDYVPDSAAFLDSLGWVYHKLGLEKEAQNYLKRAKENNPESEEIAEHYKAIYSHRDLSRGRRK